MQQKSTVLALAACCLVVLVVAIVVGAVSFSGSVFVSKPCNNKDEGVDVVPSCLGSTSLSPAEDLSHFVDFFKELTGVSEEDLSDSSSAQYKALDWLATLDAYANITDFSSLPDTAPLIQKYALATLYFALGGSNWSYCNWEWGSTGYRCSKSDQTWLTAEEECEWFALGCEWTDTGMGMVTSIDFRRHGNNLTGSLPQELSLLTGLEEFIVGRNFIEGDMERATQNLTNLKKILVDENLLEGPVPSSILKSNVDLQFLSLSGNIGMTGSIPWDVLGTGVSRTWTFPLLALMQARTLPPLDASLPWKNYVLATPTLAERLRRNCFL